MKKIYAAAVAAIAIASATPAFAQVAQPNDGVVGSVVMNLSADVSQICGVVDNINPVAVNFGDLAAVATTAQVTMVNNVTVVCNDPAGGTVSVVSSNAGRLLRNGNLDTAGNVIPYTFQATGGNGLAIPAGTTLGTAVTRPFSGSTAMMAGSGLTFRFTVNGVLESNQSNINNGERTTVFEGTYTDVVTVSVTAN
ncbi:spore coat protein U domain-containing protein [Sphingomonas sp. CJ99]